MSGGGEAYGRMRVLTWNLFHGRAVPPAGHELLGAFAATLAGWSWDVALLQEVPPWWPPALARGSGRERAHRADVAQRAAAAAPGGRRALARPHEVQRRRAPTRSSCAAQRIAEHRRAPAAPAARAARRARRAPGRTAPGSPTSTRRCTPRSARRPTSRAPATARARAGPATRPSSSAATSTCAGPWSPGLRARRRPRRRPRPRPRLGRRRAAASCPSAAALSDHAPVLVELRKDSAVPALRRGMARVATLPSPCSPVAVRRLRRQQRRQRLVELQRRLGVAGARPRRSSSGGTAAPRRAAHRRSR